MNKTTVTEIGGFAIPQNTHEDSDATIKITEITDVNIALWHEVFGDDESTIRNIVEGLKKSAKCFCVYLENKPVAQAITIPLNYDGLKGLYVYAVATKAEFRMRGYMRRILDSVREYATERNLDFLIILPSDDKLRESYERQGYIYRIPLFSNANPICPEDICATLQYDKSAASDVRCDMNTNKGVATIIGDATYEQAYESFGRQYSFDVFISVVKSYDNVKMIKTNVGCFMVSSQDERFVLASPKNTEMYIDYTERADCAALVMKLSRFDTERLSYPEPLPR